MTREQLKEAICEAESLNEVFKLLGIAKDSSEAYYVRIVWEALHYG